jgi:hypothetical protein
MKNHTKGEWVIRDTHPTTSTTIECNGVRICEVKHFSGSKILNDPDYEEGLANAELIIAAPKMLALLQKYSVIQEINDFLNGN